MKSSITHALEKKSGGIWYSQVSDYSVVDPDTVKSEPRTSGRRIKTM
jgi:hypothetical protein